MPTKLNFATDIQGKNAYAPDFSNVNFSTTLSTGVEQTFTIPSDNPVWIASLGYQPGTTVWVARNQTATLPGGAFSSTNSTIIPGARRVYAGDVIHMITSTATAEVGISLYEFP